MNDRREAAVRQLERFSRIQGVEARRVVDLVLAAYDAAEPTDVPTKQEVDAAYCSDVLRDVRDALSSSQYVEREALDEVIAFLDPREVQS